MDPSKEDLDAYVAQLTDQEKIVLAIAEEHLESSFDLVRSIGFREWFAKRHTPDK